MTKLTGFRWLDLRSPVRALSRCNAPFSSRLSCSPMNAGHRMDAFHFPSFALLVTGQIEKHRVKRIPHNFFVNCVLPNFGLHTRDFSDIGASLLLGLWILRYFGRYFSFFFWKFNENDELRQLYLINDWNSMSILSYSYAFLRRFGLKTVILVPLLRWFGRESFKRNNCIHRYDDCASVALANEQSGTVTWPISSSILHTREKLKVEA